MHKIAENVYLEVGSGEPIESENLVEFHLLYGGPLHSGGHDNPREEKHSIRRVFHSQLKRLWQTHPNLRRMAQMGGSTIVIKGDAVNTDFRVMFANKPIPERNNMLVQLGLKELGEKWSRGKYKFVPLVTEERCLRCILEILFLRAEEQNYILQSGDIDGRLKALFDALRIAESGELPPKASPTSDEDPFYCLLQDDKLISEVRVNTGQLLKLPDAKPLDKHDVYLQITVRLNSAQLTNWSWVF